jgi:hypothetical protein
MKQQNAASRTGVASIPVSNIEQERAGVFSKAGGKRQKKEKQKDTRTRICTRILGFRLTVIGGQRVAITLYGLANSLTVRPRGRAGVIVIERGIVVADYILLGGCLPVGGGWRDAAESQTEECRSGYSDWIAWDK